ncbi:MAG: phosphoribosyltransferase [Gammaproteobacteria bacterium HGW-Gammaproteobacteria-3]|nr:MAG: phosphoribosyltransferase [Gammaproteobacteria bacterium HGW-Gammaproteobacteria-3]
MMNNWLGIIQDYLLPPTCILCANPGEGGMDICRACKDQLGKNTPCCYRCGALFVQHTPRPLLCGACQKSPISFDETHAPFIYQGAIRYLISGLKFRAEFKNARLLAMLMAEHLATLAEHPEFLVPVPLHPSRYRERGFNQALEIARTLGREMGIPVHFDGCIRQRNTPHQIDLASKQRRKNMKNAFAVRHFPNAGHVAIIDDVMTTGATASELAMAMKRAGAARVDVWVCARA